MWMTSHSWLHFLKPCRRLSFSDLLQSAVPYWNQCKLFMCHHNLNVHNVVFWIFWCRTLNNFNKLSVIICQIIISNKKQTSWPYKQYYVKTSRCFYQKLYDVFFKCRENWKRAEIQTWEILEDHLWEIIYM